MKITKRINNNVAFGLDGNGQEIIVIGKGIGFGNLPYELTDLSRIDRTYYDIDQKYYALLQEIPEKVFILVSKLIDVARSKIEGELNPNLVFTLADHINFAVARTRKGMDISLPYSYELEYEYPQITRIAKWVVKNINQKMHVSLPKGEITSITMHFLNALEGRVKQTGDSNKEADLERVERIIGGTVRIIEEFFSITLDKTNFNFFRFKNHMKYFVKRKEEGTEFYDNNSELYESMKSAYPKISECVARIDDYILEEFQERCSEDELLYLIIHVNRLYTKEDCNRKGITSEEQ